MVIILSNQSIQIILNFPSILNYYSIFNIHSSIAKRCALRALSMRVQ